MTPSPIKLIVGLGNPGDQYAKTRHNAGFLFLHALKAAYDPGASWASVATIKGRLCALQLSAQSVRLLEPATFMNLSGDAVRAAMDYFKIDVSEILIVHDELDLPPGSARLKIGGGHGSNNGLRDVIKKLGSPDFLRLRIGIGHPGVGRDVSSYVLKRANAHDQTMIDDAIAAALSVMPQVINAEVGAAMNELHTVTPRQ